MKKTYIIEDVVVKHPKLGNINKQVIIYLIDGQEEFRENYIGEIRSEYNQKTPNDIVLDLVSKMSPESIEQLKTLLR